MLRLIEIIQKWQRNEFDLSVEMRMLIALSVSRASHCNGQTDDDTFSGMQLLLGSGISRWECVYMHVARMADDPRGSVNANTWQRLESSGEVRGSM